MDMTTIERLAAAYAAERDRLAQIANEVNEAVTRIRLDAAPALRAACASTAAAERALREAVAAAPNLFERPRTRVFHGVKCGFRKGRGRVVIEDEEKTIARIRDLLPADQATLLIRVRESVNRNAVADLSVGDCKRLGIVIVQDDDEVVVSPADTDIDRLVTTLLDGLEAAA